MSGIRILHTAPGLWAETGGPAHSVPALCSAQAGLGGEVVLLSGKGPTDRSQSSCPGVRVELARLGPYSLGRYSLEFRRKLVEESSATQVVHTHGIWLFPNWQSVLVAKSAGKPSVVSPRGMLQPWAVRRSRLRKKVAWRLAARSMFDRLAFIHVTSRAELEAIRDMGIHAPIVQAPNGVDLEGEFAWSRICAAKPEEDGPVKKVVFLGRIHPVKGIDLLLGSWRKLGVSPSRAKLVIAGPGDEREVEKLTAWLQNHPGVGVDYIGPVDGEEKLNLLSSAWTLVCPSWSESYGMVIAEALASAIPVIATTGTPWHDLQRAACGWWVGSSVDELAEALHESLEMSESTRHEMGARGRSLVEERHSVSRTAEMLLQAYSWALGERDQPAFVDCP